MDVKCRPTVALCSLLIVFFSIAAPWIISFRGYHLQVLSTGTGNDTEEDSTNNSQFTVIEGNQGTGNAASLLLVVQNPVGVCRATELESQCTPHARSNLASYDPWVIEHLWSSAGTEGVNGSCEVSADCGSIVVEHVLNGLKQKYHIPWNEYWPEIGANARHSEWHSQAHCARFVEGFGADCEEAAEDYFYQVAKLYESVNDQLPTFLVKLGITSSNTFIPINEIKKNVKEFGNSKDNVFTAVHLGCHNDAFSAGQCTLTRIGFCYRCSVCETGTNACACSDNVQPPPCCARDHLPGEPVDCFQLGVDNDDFPSTVPWNSTSVDEDDVSCYTSCDKVCYCGHGSADCICD